MGFLDVACGCLSLFKRVSDRDCFFLYFILMAKRMEPFQSSLRDLSYIPIFNLFKDKLKHLLIYSEHSESVPNFVTFHFSFQTFFRPSVCPLYHTMAMERMILHELLAITPKI